LTPDGTLDKYLVLKHERHLEMVKFNTYGVPNLHGISVEGISSDEDFGDHIIGPYMCIWSIFCGAGEEGVKIP
jgi:hypothetical protein